MSNVLPTGTDLSLVQYIVLLTLQPKQVRVYTLSNIELFYSCVV